MPLGRAYCYSCLTIEGGIPADASALIYLAKARAYADAYESVGRLLATPAVWRESVEEGERLGYADAGRIRAAEADEIVRRVELSRGDGALASAIATEHRLGEGESETLALGRSVGRALVDDGRAARVAEVLGVVPLSTLFLPVLGVRSGWSSARALALLRQLAVVMGARADAVFEIERRVRERT